MSIIDGFTEVMLSPRQNNSSGLEMYIATVREISPRGYPRIEIPHEGGVRPKDYPTIESISGYNVGDKVLVAKSNDNLFILGKLGGKKS